jgi:DNA-binding CsgD family transcriptional regulator
MIDKGLTHRQIGILLNRTESAIVNHVRALRERDGIEPHYYHLWSWQEEEMAVRMKDEGYTARAISEIIGCSPHAVYQKLKEVKARGEIRA